VNKTAKYTVDEIEEQARVTLRRFKGRRGMEIAEIEIAGIRSYAKKVLFLCRELKKKS